MSELVFHGPRETLDAGGIAATAESSKDERTGVARARAYRHPAIRARTVVRLEVDAMSRGADAEMDALGFVSHGSSDPLGRAHVRAAGFPAWALIHMPELARYALAITRDFKKAEKLAFSKPGHAKDAFEEIATKLGRTVPAFLPSYWEEVGRVYLRADSTQYAAQSFERARRAEKEFALTVDEAARDAAFLEFSLAGAVAVKSLVAYAKDLANASGSEAAYVRMRELAVRRCLGGLPPWASMVKDLRALAKNAGRNLAAEDDELVRLLLPSPSLARAPVEFFESLKASILRVVADDPVAKLRLGTLFPSAGYNFEENAKRSASYLSLVEATGVFEQFATGPREHLPSDGLGAFLGRLVLYAGPTELVERVLTLLAPRLVETGESVDFTVRSGYRQSISIDLVERALELGVAIRSPAEWLEFSFDVPFTRDPVRIAAHPVYGPKLAAAVGAAFGPGLERRSAGMRGMTAARRAWVASRVAGVEGGSLFDAARALHQLELLTRAATFVEFAEERERLLALDFVDVLARALQLGFVDELAWPEYEEVARELGGRVVVEGAFPYVVVRSSVRAICLGPSGRLVEHDFVLDPQSESVASTHYVDGVLLVHLRANRTHRLSAYYSHAPHERFESSFFAYIYGERERSVVFEDGSTSFGQRAMRRGDRDVSIAAHVRMACDGRDVFSLGNDYGSQRYQHIDRTTGKPIRAARPTFLEAGTVDGSVIDAASFVLPVPGASARVVRPMDDLIGMRVVTTDHGRVVESLDGLRVAWSGPDLPQLLLRFPGDDSIAVVSMGRPRPGDVTWQPTIFDAEGRIRALPGTSRPWSFVYRALAMPPSLSLAFATARDADGSRALRAVSAAIAGDLLAAASQDLDAIDDAAILDVEKLGRTMDRIGATLPDVKDVALRSVVALAAAHAHRLAQKRDRLMARADDSMPTLPTTDAHVDDGTAIAALLATSGEVTIGSLSFLDWLLEPRASAWLALAPIRSDRDRERDAGTVELLLSSGFVDRASDLRLFDVPSHERWQRISADFDTRWKSIVRSFGTSRLAFHHTSPYVVAELARGGKFADLSAQGLTSARYPSGMPLRPFLEAFVKLVRERPSASWPVDLKTRIAASAKLTQAEAILLLTGRPMPNGHAKDFLGASVRKTLDVKTAEADTARARLAAYPDRTIREALEAGLPDDLASMPGLASGAEAAVAVDRLAVSLQRSFGASVVVPEFVAIAVDQDLATSLPGAKLLAAWCAPGTSPFFELAQKDASPWYRNHREEFGAPFLEAAAQLLGFAQLRLRRSDPLRAHAGAFLGAIRSRLADARTGIVVATSYTDPTAHDATITKLASLLGANISKKDDAFTIDAGAIAIQGRSYWQTIEVRASEWARMDRTVLRAVVQGSVTPAYTTLFALDYLLSDGATELVRVLEDPAGDGFDADPRVSAPGSVDYIARRHGLSEDAATLYLQTLALPEPTTKSVLEWNGWSSPAYDAAIAALLAAGLLVEASRERAGRRAFLPGEWCKARNDDLPYEGWKNGFARPSLGRAPRAYPYVPLRTLFEKACERLEGGDVPRFEEVR